MTGRFKVLYNNTNATEFKNQVFPFLLKQETENTMNVGLIQTIAETTIYPIFHLFQVIDLEDGNNTVFVALWTPPHFINFSKMQNEDLSFQKQVMKSFAEYLHKDPESPIHGKLCDKLPGCNGVKQEVLLFVEEWTACLSAEVSVEATIEHNERLYKLDPQDLVMKACTNASEYELVLVNADVYKKCEGLRETMLDYIAEFEIFIGMDKLIPSKETRRQRSMKMMETRVLESKIYLVVDKKYANLVTGEEKYDEETVKHINFEEVIVSFVGITASSPNTRRIAPVFTPAMHRKKGFASFGVSQLCHRLFNVDKVAKHICLFTDLTNPTSNKIYTDIGFKPLVDVDRHKLQYSTNSSEQRP